MDRIEINGEWYIKESLAILEKQTTFINKDDIIKIKTCVWGDDKFCFESSHNIDIGDLEMIEFTDKRNQSHPYTEIECWDNELWFKRVIDNDKGVWDEFVDNDIVKYTKEFINLTYNIYH
jgi:hypothetical protein